MLFLLLAAACTTAYTTSDQTCTLAISAVEPAEVAPGDTLTIYASPLTETWDTTANIGATPVESLVVDRADCEACDTCREDEGCDLCGDCDACDLSCAASCVETVQVLVPALPPGEAQVLLYNSRGSSRPFPVQVRADDSGAP